MFENIFKPDCDVIPLFTTFGAEYHCEDTAGDGKRCNVTCTKAGDVLESPAPEGGFVCSNESDYEWNADPIACSSTYLLYNILRCSMANKII